MLKKAANFYSSSPWSLFCDDTNLYNQVLSGSCCVVREVVGDSLRPSKTSYHVSGLGETTGN